MGGERGRAEARLRITFVALNYAPSIGGAQQYVGQVAEGLAALGHHVEVLTTDALRSPASKDPGRIPERVESCGGVHVRRHRVPTWLRQPHRWLRWANVNAPWRRPGAHDGAVHPALAGPMSPGLWRAARRAVRSRDVVVAVSAPFLTFVLPPRFAGPDGAATVGLPLLHAGRDAPHRQVGASLRRCRASVAATPFERDLHTTMGLQAEEVTVIAPGVEVPDAVPGDPAEAKARLGLEPRPTVGYVGRLAAYKGIDVFLDAVVRLWETHPDTTVLVAGASTGWEGHRTHEAQRRAAGRLVVREDFGSEERTDLLAACDVVACPSRDESYGLGILEAWAAGRPVVASDLAAVRGIVRPGVDGLLVEVGDASSLATALAGLLDDPGEARRLGRAGREHVVEDLAWPVAVARWDRLLAELTPPATADRREREA